MAPRFALYYAPEISDPLHQAASSWLGRDADSNAPCTQPSLPDITGITGDAGNYGFHATLKPPMRLRDGVTWHDLLAETIALAATIPAFDLPHLAVADLHGFLALRETEPSTNLQALADACVAGVDHLRQPPEGEEIAKRRKSQLSPVMDANLIRWGYPYVFATWYFHMTLTRRLNDAERTMWMPAAEAHFAASLAMPRRVAVISIFSQAKPGTAFVVAARVKLAE
ncbi:MAG: DUF1045 domain-containing protein [Acetobacteraceae bacterium]|nr:DUF1045 domain-containing protein [Acetobacteraceae bacterium]